MKLFVDFFTTDVGLMSAGVIFFIIGMAFYLISYARRHMREELAQQTRH
ncbi:Protein of unknown function [Solimonas aquatica]|uniref:DUF3149 domain-containing protein n=1 Tax=Solimonas aquatica TaxID=489703 RepID=A0A1H9CSS2_9GAMM|nr:DUF3149 domain-containing protein [Solimonas aquatica]SEQ04270.1 Protein of unknown function [Solimonas aquatica]